MELLRSAERPSKINLNLDHPSKKAALQMPEKNLQIIGKSFQADYSQIRHGWKCELTSMTGEIAVDGFGQSKDASLENAREKAAEEIRTARREINEMLFKDKPPTDKEMNWAIKRIKSVMNGKKTRA